MRSIIDLHMRLCHNDTDFDVESMPILEKNWTLYDISKSLVLTYDLELLYRDD